MRAAIVVDNPYRDLPSMTLCAAGLCQKGVTCYLVPFNLMHLEIWRLAPDFILSNYLRPNKEEFYKDMVKAGLPFGVLDTEGGVMESFDVYGDLLVKDKKVRRYVSFFCSWGPKMADYLIERDWFDEKQVQITGTPRTDFYHGSLRKSAKARSRYVDPYCKNLVLINSNFTIGNPGFLTPKEEFELLVRLGREPDEVRKRQANDGESIKLLTNMANRLAERFEEANFIYRPHPFERHRCSHRRSVMVR